MQEVTVEEIKRLAEKYSAIGDKWHFHILTPECQLNKKGGYALILENDNDLSVHACHSENPYLHIGKELVQLLHGSDVIKNHNANVPPSPQVKKLLEKAAELTNKEKFWHHHMLFPNCMFNKHKGKWTIIFEDRESNKLIESITESEPKSDLRYIETLFYNQKK